MDRDVQVHLQDLDEDAALRAIIEGTATETGERFFAALVKNLAKAMPDVRVCTNCHSAGVDYFLTPHPLQ